MAQRYDVPARLAEGREAVAHTQTYVSACGRRGYQHPDLTASAAQIQDWYDGEDGLDLRVLDDDCAELGAVVDAAEEGLQVQRAQLDELAAAWRGPGAAEATGFLERHCAAGAALTARLHAAAEACGALRDDLWRIVDDKVTAAVDIDDRAAAQRPVWLAAAGGEMRQATGDIVDRQVKPYVDNDIRIDWLAAMRSAQARVAAAYDAAIAATSPGSGTVFQIPAGLGPRFGPDDPPAPIAPAAAAAPAESLAESPSARAGAPPPAVEPLDDRLSAPFDDPLSALPDDATGWPAPGGLPGDLGLPTGAGLPGGAGGLGGLIPRIVDAIGGLLGSPDNDVTDPWPDDPFNDEPPGDQPDDEPGDDEPEADGETAPADEIDQTGADPGPDEPGDEVVAEETPDDAAAAPADQRVDPPPPQGPDPQADAAEPTPCEIAADELPQAGR
ncbi:MAG TPA: hypothetical protein VFR27_07335 [Mycobacterium sp.]|nr:hypothetical protein [Mycobacterium sp.]